MQPSRPSSSSTIPSRAAASSSSRQSLMQPPAHVGVFWGGQNHSDSAGAGVAHGTRRPGFGTWEGFSGLLLQTCRLGRKTPPTPCCSWEHGHVSWSLQGLRDPFDAAVCPQPDLLPSSLKLSSEAGPPSTYYSGCASVPDEGGRTALHVACEREDNHRVSRPPWVGGPCVQGSEPLRCIHIRAGHERVCGVCACRCACKGACVGL